MVRVKESFSSSCCSEALQYIDLWAASTSAGVSDTAPLYATLLYTTAPCHPDAPSDLYNTSICLSPLHFDRADTLFQKNSLQSDIAESEKRKEKKKERDVYIREKKKHGACGYNYTQAAQW